MPKKEKSSFFRAKEKIKADYTHIFKKYTTNGCNSCFSYEKIVFLFNFPKKIKCDFLYKNLSKIRQVIFTN